MWQKIKRQIHRAMIRKEIKIKRKRLRHKDWWDRSCTRKKREVKNWYSELRIGVTTKERYLVAKKERKELQIKKQQEKRKEEEAKLKKLRKDTEVWNYINNRKGKREWKEQYRQRELEKAPNGIFERKGEHRER